MTETSATTSNREIAERLKRHAHRLGFAWAGVCPAVSAMGVSRLNEWLAAGYAGEMNYLAARAAAYAHPRHVLDGAKSIVMLAAPYSSNAPPSAPGGGRVSRYAAGRDYHDIVHERLHKLVDELKRSVPGATARGVVDSAPLMEREYAVLAGLGWVGKNTLVLNRQLGSWFFLAALLTSVDLPADEPQGVDHCGTCRACLDACPTDAFVQPYVLDARRCISYLTIEHRSPIPRELRPGMGDWLFGCDVCQDVCPWNHHVAGNGAAQPDQQIGENANASAMDLLELFYLDDESFRARFRQTPLWRPKRRGLLRNAAIVLGNQRRVAAVPALLRGLEDEESLIRGASAWALGQMGSPDALAALSNRLSREADQAVREEIELALAEATGEGSRANRAPPCDRV